MENQPSRPWFRLASQSRMEPPPARPPTLRPTIVQALRPPPTATVPPQTQPQPQPPPGQPLSQTQPGETRFQTTLQPTQVADQALPSPKPTKTSPKSQPAEAQSQTTTLQSTRVAEAPPSPGPRPKPPKTSSSSTSSPPTPQSTSTVPAQNPVPLQKVVSPVAKPSESPSKNIIKSSNNLQTSVQSNLTKTADDPGPPSPLSLPPSQLPELVPEIESKPMVVSELKSNAALMQGAWKERRDDELIIWRNVDDNHESSRDINDNNGGRNYGRFDKEKDARNRRKLEERDQEKGLQLISIAGENRGAYMEVAGRASTNHDDDNYAHVLVNKSSRRSRSNGISIEDGKPSMSAFVNNNVQGVNNSILFNSTCAHSDPGVHYSVVRKPTPSPATPDGVFHPKAEHS